MAPKAGKGKAKEQPGAFPGGPPDVRLDENGPWILRDRPIPMTYAELRAEGRVLERREIMAELAERMRGSRGWARKAGKLDALEVLLDFQQWLEGRGR